MVSAVTFDVVHVPTPVLGVESVPLITVAVLALLPPDTTRLPFDPTSPPLALVTGRPSAPSVIVRLSKLSVLPPPANDILEHPGSVENAAYAKMGLGCRSTSADTSTVASRAPVTLPSPTTSQVCSTTI